MGIRGVSPGSLLLIFFVVLILFGTKKLRTIGEDLGHAFRGFKKGLEGIDDEEIRHTNYTVPKDENNLKN